MKILVTGATGFIGRRLVEELLSQGVYVSVLTRDEKKARGFWPTGLDSIRVADLSQPASLSAVCRGIHIVFHLAGYAHAVDEEDDRVAERHDAVTVAGTRALLTDALHHGVKRVVYASSVKAMGEGGEHCLDETAPVEPVTAYGRSRRAAETMLLNAARTGAALEAVIVRFPLVYGRGNQGNLLRMIAAIDHGRFPPLPRLHNRRSLVWVDDAVQALLCAADKPQAAGQIYLVTDGHDYSTDEIYTHIRAALGKPTAVWNVPLSLLRLLARIGDVIGRLRRRPWMFDSTALSKLTDSACYRSDKIQKELGYRPRRTLADVLPEMIDEYRSQR